MYPGATRIFTSVIHEFAQSIDKEYFNLVGEITGGREQAFETLEKTGLNALALTVCTVAIPCIYYGSEQFFNGHGNDRYLREAMFGGEFGAFENGLFSAENRLGDD
jgi:hypothetical protein